MKSVNKVVVSTPDLFLKAKQVTKGNASNLLGNVTKTLPAGSLPLAPNPASPGAVRGPSDRYAEAGNAIKDARGFAPGDAGQPAAPANSQGAVEMILNLLQRLLSALKNLLSGSASQGEGNCGSDSGSGSGGASGGGAPGGAGGGGPGLCNNGNGFPPSELLGGPRGPRVYPIASQTPNSGQGGSGLSNPTPPAGTQPNQGKKCGSWVKGLLKTTVKVGAGAAAGGVPGAVLGGVSGIRGGDGTNASQGSHLSNSGGAPGAGCQPPAQSPPSGCGPKPGAGSSGGCAPGAQGGSLEDRIFSYLSKLLREIEGELESAMQKDGGGAGGADGGSRTASSQKVQQLVQKRAEMVEMVTNVLKSLFDTSQAVNRNIK